MIIEFIPTKKGDARGSYGAIIEYMYDVSNHADNKTDETVQYIGTSDSLCAPNPFYSFVHHTCCHQANKTASPEQHAKADLRYLKSAVAAIERKNSKVKKPYHHIVFSFQQGERLTNTQLHALIQDYVNNMGYTDHHWCAVNHLNTDNNHAHLLLSCISNSPPHHKFKDGNNFEKSALIRHELEQKYGLNHDNNPFLNERGLKVNNPTIKNNIQALRATIDMVLSKTNGKKLSLPDFVNQIMNKGVGCHVQLSQGDVKGLSFSLGKHTFRASKLGKGYRFSDLEQCGVFYDKAQ